MKTRTTIFCCFFAIFFFFSCSFVLSEDLAINNGSLYGTPPEAKLVRNKFRRFGNWIEKKTGNGPPQTLKDLELDLADEKIKLEKSRKDYLELQEKLRAHLEKANRKKLELEQEILETERKADFHQSKVDFYKKQILEIKN